MNKRQLVGGLAVGIVLGLGFWQTLHAWSFGADVKTEVNSDSNNRRDAINIRDGTYSSTANSNNETYNQRYDNRRDNSIRADNSFNTTTDNRDFSDNRDFGISTTEIMSGTQRIGSNDTSISTRDVSNSALGNFNQYYTGTDLSSGINGSGNTIDARSINIATFGDSLTN